MAQESAAVIDAPSLPVQGDGEFIGRPPVVVEMVPKAIRVVVPIESEPEPGLPDLVDLTS
jgi:diacylglycerol kinase family enzyme